MAGLTIDAAETPFTSQMRGQGVVTYPFTGAAAAGDATTVLAAGAAGTRHLVVGIQVDVDTAGEALAIGGLTRAVTLRFPVVDFYNIVFNPPLECVAATALTLDKGTVAEATGRLHVKPSAQAGDPVRL